MSWIKGRMTNKGCNSMKDVGYHRSNALRSGRPIGLTKQIRSACAKKAAYRIIERCSAGLPHKTRIRRRYEDRTGDCCRSRSPHWRKSSVTGLQTEAEPYVAKLAARFGLVTHLGVLDEGRLVYTRIEKMDTSLFDGCILICRLDCGCI